MGYRDELCLTWPYVIRHYPTVSIFRQKRLFVSLNINHGHNTGNVNRPFKGVNYRNTQLDMLHLIYMRKSLSVPSEWSSNQNSTIEIENSGPHSVKVSQQFICHIRYMVDRLCCITILSVSIELRRAKMAGQTSEITA